MSTLPSAHTTAGTDAPLLDLRIASKLYGDRTILAGIPGALIAVPLVAFLNTTIRALRAPLPEDATADQQERVVYEEVEGEPPPDAED